jgi:hypothetical protein
MKKPPGIADQAATGMPGAGTKADVKPASISPAARSPLSTAPLLDTSVLQAETDARAAS